MSRILADKVTNYNNDGPFEAEKGINIPLARPLQVSGNAGVSGQYLVSTGVGLTWETFPELFSGDYNDLTNRPTLFSGSYNDLTNKPVILNLNLNNVDPNQYLKYNGTQWVNTDLPTIYQYDISVNDVGTNSVEVRLTDQFSEQTSFFIVGADGIGVALDVNGSVAITPPVVSEYDADIAKDDISNMFLDGTNTGITYTYNPITKTIDSAVSLAEQLVYTLYGTSTAANTAKIYLDNGTEESGAVNIVGTNGIDISWDIGTSTISFSKTDPAPYVLPAATTTTLGGVIPNASDFTIDGNGNLNVNFPASGITLTDLSVAPEGTPSGNGALSYDNSTGQFTYTPPAFSIDDLTDVGIASPLENQVLSFIGTTWQNTTLNVVSNLSELDDVSTNTPNNGDYLVYTGISWEPITLNISSESIHSLSDVSMRSSDDAGQILQWSGTSWDSIAGKLENFDVSAQATNGQILVWNSTTSLWDPTTFAGGGGASTLDDLTDVSVTGANSGDYLAYNGIQWASVTPPTVPQTLSDLYDVSTAAPSNGYVLTWNSTSNEWQPAASGASPGAGLTSRTTASAVTNSIADLDYDLVSFNGFKSYSLMKIETDVAAWVTLYCDDASRTADLSRPETTDPTPGSGVVAEVITTGAQTVLMTPTVIGFNNDSTPGATIYAKVVNKSGSTQVINVTLTLLQLEA